MGDAHATTTCVHENEAFGKSETTLGLVKGAGDLFPGLDETALDVFGSRDRCTVMRAMIWKSCRSAMRFLNGGDMHTEISASQPRQMC